MQVQIPFQIKRQAVHLDPLRGGVVDKPNRQAGGQGMQDGFDGIGASIPSQQYGRLVPFEDEWPTARRILRSPAIKTPDRRARVSTADPLILTPEMEAGQVGVVLDRLDRAK